MASLVLVSFLLTSAATAESQFYSSTPSQPVQFTMTNPTISPETINKIWPGMSVTFTGMAPATALSVSAYVTALLAGDSPFGGPKGNVLIPTNEAGPDQLGWSEYVAYTRKQVCYIAANIVAGNNVNPDVYNNGLQRLIPPTKCDDDLYRAGFKRALIGLLAACSVDPTMQGNAQGPMLVVAKATNDVAKAPSASASSAKLADGGLSTCRFRDGSDDITNTQIGSIPITKSPCKQPENDFMRGGAKGQAIVDISAEWIGGYVLAAGGCGGFDGGQDERLMTYMPEIMTLAFFMSKQSSSDPAGVSLHVPAYILGARRIFSGFDGTSRDAGPAFNQGQANAIVSPSVPFNDDLVTVSINGMDMQISGSTPFLGFQSNNQMVGTANITIARVNQGPKQFVPPDQFSFQNQVAAWYNAISLDSYHKDVQAMLPKIVTSIGTGPWGSGVWWGNSQVFFLVMWIGQAMAKASWSEAELPLDYYIYSSFTENPSNQCLVHNQHDCQACLEACDNTGSAGSYGQGTNLRYCCMEPEPWGQPDGRFDGQACIPASLGASVCGTNGLGDVYAKYSGKTVQELMTDLQKALETKECYPASTKCAGQTLFDVLLSQSEAIIL